MPRFIPGAGIALALALLPALTGTPFAPSRVAVASTDLGNTSASLPTDPTVVAAINRMGDDQFTAGNMSKAFAHDAEGEGQHYGPYASTSPDSSTCGNDWATDTFDRHFFVRKTGPNTYTVIELFADGKFVTIMGPSPGGCDTNVGGTIRSGVRGELGGYFVISNVGAQTSHSRYCDAVAMTNANCTTTTFMNTHFAPCYPATCQVTTYYFRYTPGDQGLVLHQWINASCDRGGNRGDIASTLGVVKKSSYCP